MKFYMLSVLETVQGANVRFCFSDNAVGISESISLKSLAGLWRKLLDFGFCVLIVMQTL